MNNRALTNVFKIYMFDDTVCVGKGAAADSGGTAIGCGANGYAGAYGCVAVDFVAASGSDEGTAVGTSAAHTNMAIGGFSKAEGDHPVVIGDAVTNGVNNRTAIRGSLCLDGGTGGLCRSTGGTGSWTVKAFAIDRPLDPKNKVLRHFCMEGADVLTLIDENANEFPPAKVSKKVADNQFETAGIHDVAVSWMIEALRNDPGSADDLKRRPVEQLKQEQTALENQTAGAFS